MRNKSVLILVGLLAFIAIVGGISYSYFVYNKKLGDISINTGEIAINYSGVNGNLSLSNVIPMSDNDGMTTSSYIDFTVDATVDTDKIYYELYIMPKSGNTLNTDYLKTYLTNQQNVKISEVTLYKDLSNSEKSGGKTIYKGLVNINNDGSKKTYSKAFRLRLWLDDTYQETASKTFEFDIYLHAYNVQNVNAKNISYNGEDCSNVQCELEALAGVEIQKPLCKRATTLHTETCNQGENADSYNCYYDGYYVGGTKNTTTVTYGSLGTTGELPQIGDAFDCDVNGDGLYNSTTERFYYVSDYFNTNTSSFDNTRAVLIYSNNTVNGVVNDGGAAYYGTWDSYDNWHGPTTAIAHLPLTTGANAWRDNLLETDNRKIQACNDNNCTTLSDSTTGGTIVQTEHIYAGKAARLIHLKEIKKGCITDLSERTSLSNECNFLMENTKYTNASKQTYGLWTENPVSLDARSVWNVLSSFRSVYSYGTFSSVRGVRPVIDVPMDRIKY